MKKFFLPLLLGGCLAGHLSAKDGEIPSAEETVKTLYTEHLAGKGALLDPERKQFWNFIFGEDLVKELKSGNWGFDPLIFAQDAEVKDLKVKEIEKDDKSNSLVLVTFTNFGERTVLVVATSLTDHGHRILNVTQPSTGVDLIHDLADEP